jgi:hypothetical protein
MTDHENAPNPRQQAVEVLAITLIDMILHDAIPHKSPKVPPDDPSPVAIRSPEQQVRIP